MQIIGIDIGTTTISGAVLEYENEKTVKLLEAKTIENGGFMPTANEWEKIQDAGAIVKKAEKLLDDLLDKYPQTERIGLTGQMHGIVYIDQTGTCVSPLYTWQDGRGSLCEKGQCSLVQEIKEKCDLEAASGYGLVTHICNLKHGLIPERAVGFCTIMDYFGMCLTGRKKPVVHVSNAAGFGFFDGRNMKFETEKLSKMGVKENWLPEVCTGIEKLGLYRNRQVTTAIGDNQASFLGAAGKEENTLLVNMGTGGQISILSDQYFAEKGIEARPFLNGKYLLVGSSLCGGKSYALLEQFFRRVVKAATGEDSFLYPVMEQFAKTGKEQSNRISEDRKLKIRTTFDGTRTDPKSSGSIQGLTSDNFTPEAFTYGILEGMGDELYQMYRTIKNGIGIQIKNLIGSGNGVRKNPVFCEMLEELFTFTKLKNDSFHLEMSSCCINKILKDTIFSYYDEWTGRGIEPEIQITDKLLFMNGNEQGIQRIFQNIIKNGLDHGEKKISISLEEVENNIRIQIKNQVCHVEKINVDQVFERFYKADEARSKTSSGLGLSIAKELVLRMDGKISARIEGNEFCVEIVFPK